MIFLANLTTHYFKITFATKFYFDLANIFKINSNFHCWDNKIKLVNSNLKKFIGYQLYRYLQIRKLK